MDKKIKPLGEELLTYQGKTFYENGIRQKDTTFLWDDIKTVYYEATQHFEVIIPTHATMEIRIKNYSGNGMLFYSASLITIGGRKKEEIKDVYTFIISKIFDRQYQELIHSIENGERVSFGDFEISQHSVYRKKLFGGYDIIDSNRIAGCSFDNGEFVIEYIDDNRRIKKKKCGYVRNIPNLHLARYHLLSLAEKNKS